MALTRTGSKLSIERNAMTSCSMRVAAIAGLPVVNDMLCAAHQEQGIGQTAISKERFIIYLVIKKIAKLVMHERGPKSRD